MARGTWIKFCDINKEVGGKDNNFVANATYQIKAIIKLCWEI